MDEITHPYIQHSTGMQIWEHLKLRVSSALAQGKINRDRIATYGDMVAHSSKLLDFFLAGIGGLPHDADKIVQSFSMGEVDGGDFTIQKILLETRVGVRASTNFYLPKTTGDKKLPAVLFLCGHSTEGKAHDQYQSVCRKFLRRGFAVLALDPTGQGERLNYYEPSTGEIRIRPATGDHEYCGFQCLLQGQNLNRYLLHDAIRAMDYLCAHPRIDASRIAVTGSSGGGTQTSLMMLVEPRIAAAAPATFITTRQAIFDSGYAQDSEQIWAGFTGEGYDHADLLMAFAPKPLCLLAVNYDFFPIEGFRKTAKEARRFWELCGRPDQFSVVEDKNVHLYTDTIADAAADFFAKFLPSPVKKVEVRESSLPVDILSCTRSGQVRGDFPDARTIHQENLDIFRDVRRKRNGAHCAEAVEFLRKAVFNNARRTVDLNLRITRNVCEDGLRIRRGYWWTQEGLINSGTLVEKADDHLKPVTLGIWEDGDDALANHEQWIYRQIARGGAVLVPNLTGVGPLQPDLFNRNTDRKSHYGTFFRIADDLISLGDSTAALRIYDVIRLLQTLPEWGGLLPEEESEIYCHGKYGIYGVLASVLKPNLRLISWKDPLPSFEELITAEYYDDIDIKSLIIPGLVRFADWPDLLKIKQKDEALQFHGNDSLVEAEKAASKFTQKRHFNHVSG